jgi:hypothetical protein
METPRCNSRYVGNRMEIKDSSTFLLVPIDVSRNLGMVNSKNMVLTKMSIYEGLNMK